MRKRVDPINAEGYQEILVAVVGSVDAGKSTTIGTLVSDTLDDGRGLTRKVVFVHPHEQKSGRTSDISYQYLRDEESKRIITFCDLAGHEAYLKTTMAGLASTMPDFAIVCISDIITAMTKEHIGLCYALEIPMIFLLTKTDMRPDLHTQKIIKECSHMVKGQRSRFDHIRTLDDFKYLEIFMNSTEFKPNKTIPYIKTSNKTGFNLDLVKQALRFYPKRSKTCLNGFSIEHIYNVPGHGIVITGLCGLLPISKGDNLLVGPFSNGGFRQIIIRSIHNDYRYMIDKLEPGIRGCLCVAFKGKDKGKNINLHKGQIVIDKPPIVYKRFIARVRIANHSCTIKPKYQAFANCGHIRASVIFEKLYTLNGTELDVVRTGQECLVEMSFANKFWYYLEKGQKIAFRHNHVHGFGHIEQLLDE